MARIVPKNVLLWKRKSKRSWRLRNKKLRLVVLDLLTTMKLKSVLSSRIRWRIVTRRKTEADVLWKESQKEREILDCLFLRQWFQFLTSLPSISFWSKVRWSFPVWKIRRLRLGLNIRFTLKKPCSIMEKIMISIEIWKSDISSLWAMILKIRLIFTLIKESISRQ
jgi:hypothetical protein